MPNLKLDIIYYKTSSDFELEFNLSGCCRMRIFKDKVDSQKNLVTALARDVSRSSIILIVTDLFTENNGVETVAKAVGLNLTAPNKAEYGIKTADDIKIPSGAIPLVTKSGIYGGCIIESGPQSIIIVSNVRSLRHEIMKAYIHNYVFDVAQLAAYNERIHQNGQVLMPQRITEVNEKPVSLVQDDAVPPEEEEALEKDEETAQNAPPEEVMESEDVVSEELPTEAINEENNLQVPLDLDDEALEVENNDGRDDFETVYSNRKPCRRGSNIALLIIVILLLIGFGVLAYFFVYMPLTGQDGNLFIKDNFITDFIKEWFMN